ncbi:MAG: AAA family ATPase [Oscillospiraceae bacterium]|nr:AAA family ATPase [Oscillospiraceae bacterium]
MESYVLKSVYFKELKGLKETSINFSNTLTAIMGVNGSGKTTVIHALACAYQPPVNGHGENHRFSDFFVPNTDALWKGSEFHIVNERKDKKSSSTISYSRKYEKAFDRWAPRYGDRPKRNVYYIGIDTCLPEIERKISQTRISYTSAAKNDKTSKRIIEESAYILNKEYEILMDNTFQRKHLTGVKLRSGLKYSSLSMGTGEQRTIKILECVLNAEPYSLILIDEIDLLLHTSSLNRLVERLSKIAKEHNLQIVFTTHAIEMLELTQYVKIQYIDCVYKPTGDTQSIVYDKISSDFFYSLTGRLTRPITVYVEDEFAKSVVKKVLRIHNMSSKVEVIKYGAVENAFTLASAKILSGSDVINTLFVLDGDKYRSQEEKLEQIKKKLIGTEENIEQKRKSPIGKMGDFFVYKKRKTD